MNGLEVSTAIENIGIESDTAEVFVETGQAGALERLPVLSVYMAGDKIIISGAVVN